MWPKENAPKVMLSCDAALCVACATLYELGFCILPLAFVHVENQRP